MWNLDQTESPDITTFPEQVLIIPARLDAT